MMMKAVRNLGVVLVALSACLSSCGRTGFMGGSDSCGDGVVDVDEECDDGNTLAGDGCDPWCRLEPSEDCGNGVVDAGEECDDGNTSNSDACLVSCRDASCGDSYLWAGVEECDDGNTLAGDGCDPSCRLEVGPGCGDGVVDAGEECDDGNASNADACLVSCRDASCGDSYLWVGVEECDDGNTFAGDGCDPYCRFEVPPRCGNGTVDAGEECDDGNSSNNDACLNNCTDAECGDWFLWFGVEECDDGNTRAGDGCDPYCRFEVPPRCGDGRIDAGEECDDGNTSNNDACLNNCTDAECGDWFLWYGVEECDDGNTLPGDGCDPYCRFEAPPRCGDGRIDAGEECDDGNTSNTDACLNNCRDAFCGDYYTWAGVEECDDGNSSNTDACLNDCTDASCGDGYVWAGVEECDDGNSSNTDACLNTCRDAGCGDGYVWAGVEECDDGNSSNTDACLNTCTDAYCGDTYVWAGVEECDDGNTLPDDGCDEHCMIEHGPCYVDEDLGILTPGVRISRRLDIASTTDEWITDCSSGVEYAFRFETLEYYDLELVYYQSGHHTIGLYRSTDVVLDSCFARSGVCFGRGRDEPGWVLFVSRAPNVYYLIVEANGSSGAGTVDLFLEPLGCVSDRDLGVLSTTASTFTETTAGGTDQYRPGCNASPSGRERVVRFRLDTSVAELVLDYTQTGSHVFGIFEDVGGACDSTMWTCIHPAGASMGTSSVPMMPAGDYILIIDADDPGDEGSVTMGLSIVP